MLCIWASRATIKETMPGAFKECYPKTTAIVDATEIKVNILSSLLLQSQTYSTYKSANTFKGLLAISPAGYVTFVSSLYTGSIADKELVERSGFLSLLRRGDEVMADHGFTIAELLAPLGVSLNTPPTLGCHSQMDGTEVVETQQIASLQIHIEHAIRCVKEFDILNGDVSYLPLLQVLQIKFGLSALSLQTFNLLYFLASIIPFMQIYVLFVQCTTTKFTQVYTSSVGLDPQ